MENIYLQNKTLDPIRSVVIGLMLLSFQVAFGHKKMVTREKVNINRAWRFEFEDHPGAEKNDYSDLDWKKINLPHNFSIPYFQASTWFTGYAWYRKHLDIPANWNGREIFVEFEGAFRDAEIFLNGKLVGKNQSGYTGFSVNVTQAVKAGGNLLAVRINNSWNAQLAPLNGDHNFTGGIYRDVTLVATNKAHVTWYGTFVTTPQVSKESATANIRTEVINNTENSGTYTLRTALIDPEGKAVDSFTTSMKISAGQTAVFDQTSRVVKKPQLWSPVLPKMYKMVSTLLLNKIAVDQFETPFGFRWFKWTADKGLFVNGEHYYFKGLNVHQDHAGWASAVTNAAMVRDIKMVKEAGFDFIRGSHYPHDPSFASACDTLGILFWSENNFWGAGGFSKEGSWFSKSGAYPNNGSDQAGFEESLKNSLTKMIRINRNHPSIVCWSMCNEAFFTQTSMMPKVRHLLKELVELSRDLDPTRMAAIGGAQRGEIDKIGDIAGYNGDGARLFINPGVANVVSEYGSTIADRPGKYEPGFGDLAEQPEFTWRSGQAMWCGFDYGTTFGKLGRMGIIDYQRLPKRAWYWYRNAYMKIPPPVWPTIGVPAKLRLTSSGNLIGHADGTEDVQLVVSILDAENKEISNSPDVTLSLVSGPGEFPTGKTITFSKNSDIQILDGKAAIEFRSYYAGKSVIKASSPSLKDVFVTIISKGAPLFTNDASQAVTERPYIRQVPVLVAKNAQFNYAFHKPTHVSSESPDHTGRNVNDADTLTYWSPKVEKPNEWISVDLENEVLITDLTLLFKNNGSGDYQVLVSADGEEWVTVTKKEDGVQTNNGMLHKLKKQLSARSIKVVFSGSVPALSEIMVFSRN